MQTAWPNRPVKFEGRLASVHNNCSMATQRKAQQPRKAVAGKLRPIATVPVYAGDVSGFAKHSVMNEQPLALLGLPPVLLFMRMNENALLLSRLPNAEPKQCQRVIPFKVLKAVRQLSKHAFEIVVQGAPPVRLEAHDAFVSSRARTLRSGSLANALNRALTCCARACVYAVSMCRPASNGWRCWGRCSRARSWSRMSTCTRSRLATCRMQTSHHAFRRRPPHQSFTPRGSLRSHCRP